MPSPKGRILCTEDDPDSRESIVFVLEAEDVNRAKNVAGKLEGSTFYYISDNGARRN